MRIHINFIDRKFYWQKEQRPAQKIVVRIRWNNSCLHKWPSSAYKGNIFKDLRAHLIKFSLFRPICHERSLLRHEGLSS